MLHVKEQQARIDALCEISGSVSVERQAAVPVVVGLLRRTPSEAGSPPWRLVDHFVLEEPGAWEFYAGPGQYAVVAFQDLSQDLKLHPDEPYLGVDVKRSFECASGTRYSEIVLAIPSSGRASLGETVDISKLQAHSIDDQFTVSLSQVMAVGGLVDLADARFSSSIAEDGLWRPFDFLLKRQGGLYFLQPYDGALIPVLFVHGINGSPADFRFLIENLDRKRFQPWVYYYPSGAHLPTVADHLAQSVRKLQLQYGFDSFIVVAHSMGGLVSRGFIQRYRQGGRAEIPLFVSIATPWDGHKAAATGVKRAPAVVRVWVDMSPGSEYLQSIFSGDLGVPHYLFFTFRNDGMTFGEASDGTVSLASQLRAEAQKQAARVEGFNETHMSVLESKEMSVRLNTLLGSAAR